MHRGSRAGHGVAWHLLRRILSRRLMKSQILGKQKWIPTQPVVPPNKGDKSLPTADGYVYSPFRILTGDLDIWKGYSVHMGIRLPWVSLTELNICLMKRLPFVYVWCCQWRIMCVAACWVSKTCLHNFSSALNRKAPHCCPNCQLPVDRLLSLRPFWLFSSAVQ